MNLIDVSYFKYILSRKELIWLNWSKAKTILIIVFLIADIFLFYELYSDTLIKKSMIDDEKKQEVVKYLEKHGIHVSCNIPEISGSMPTLIVRHKIFNTDHVLKQFFKNVDDVEINDYQDKVVIKDENIHIEISKNGVFEYINKPNMLIMEKQSGNINENKAIKNMMAFFDNLGIKQKDIYHNYKSTGIGYMKFYCSQKYNDTFLDESYVEMHVVNEGVAYVRMLWFDVESNYNNKNEIINALNALIKLSELYKDGKINIEITDISLGYYFNSNVGSVEELDVTAMKEGTAIPAWRIKTNMGNIYINAYNGTPEKLIKSSANY